MFSFDMHLLTLSKELSIHMPGLYSLAPGFQIVKVGGGGYKIVGGLHVVFHSIQFSRGGLGFVVSVRPTKKNQTSYSPQEIKEEKDVKQLIFYGQTVRIGEKARVLGRDFKLFLHHTL